MFAEALDIPGGASSVALRLSARPGLAWLDGDPAHAAGRWTFIGCDPVEIVHAPAGDTAPLAQLDRLNPRAAVESVAGAPAPEDVPEWVGFVAYDAHFTEARLRRRSADRHRRSDVPALWFGRYDAVVALDGRTGAALLVGDDGAACQRLRDKLEGPVVTPQARASAPVEPDPQLHALAIERALEHIAAGDIYQVNLARRWRAAYEGDPLALWLAMRRESPVPLGFYLDWGPAAVLSRTMECFLRWRPGSGDLQTRPIKGTVDASVDDPATRLRSDPKEQAEHVMIVDLMRNDLGRVARPGSVEVSGVMDVEPFANLSHLVSTVRCKTRPDVTLRDVVEATFPPGSVTGAPKLRAMEIIEALEPDARGVYTGAVGFVDRTGGCSLAVAIRTAVIGEGQAQYWAGGGLVEASQVDREIEETRLKARVFVDGLASLGADPAVPSPTLSPALSSGRLLR